MSKFIRISGVVLSSIALSLPFACLLFAGPVGVAVTVCVYPFVLWGLIDAGVEAWKAK
jgi:hypothetical protein